MKHIVVIGGGASGMMASIYASQDSHKITVLERNERLGKKVYLTGKGRCNVTNNCGIPEFMTHVTRNSKFMYSALALLSPKDLIDFFEQNHCPLITERGKRVFPVSYKSSDIIKTLERKMRSLGVEIHFNTRVVSVTYDKSRFYEVKTATGESLFADAVILATGGLSYPSTGSTGDGYSFLHQTGHTIIKTQPALSALITNEQWPLSLQGITLKNIFLTVNKGNKPVYSVMGELLFTHFGVSGPCVIEASNHMDVDDVQHYMLTVDLKHGISFDMLDTRIKNEIASAPNRSISTLLGLLLPRRMGEVLPPLIGLEAALPSHIITREKRLQLVTMLKALPLKIKDFCSIDEAIVTRGGVNVKEFSSSTMMSKMINGLFAAGELLDVDAHTGGFNLQIAFSTGALAGYNASKWLSSREFHSKD